MSAKEKTLEDLFYETLKDIYFAEKQILKALPKMAKAVNSDDLRRAFEKHRGETEGHVERLEKVFDLIDRPARAKTCDAILGIVDEGKEIMEEFERLARARRRAAGGRAGGRALRDLAVRNPADVGSRTRFERRGPSVDRTLAEEKKTDELLTKLAEGAVNLAAA